MAHFDPDYLEFFKELAPNNHKDWFDENRKRYQKNVKDPFYAFVDEIIPEIAKIDEIKYEITAKDCVFRINRDVRFSNDKSPYKLRMSAIISPAGKKDKTYPGLYFEMGPENFTIYGGVYMLSKDQLYDCREAIAKNAKEFDKIVNDPKFKKTYGEIHGEKNKVIPKEFKEAGEKQELIYNKNWYYYCKLDPETILKDDVKKILLENYKAGKPVKDFFEKALKDG
ncbi:MAG: DUF2461 domain-containing protein [Crocinitomicaceae bacterium]|nr:DUF2461 domain-containing protein [Crocinitomicaceae bacterium]